MWGQATTATITGIITDPSGAPIVGATVTAIDQERGTTFSGPTNTSGIYNLQRLPAANYTLSVEATGFQKAVQPVFTLVLNQVANLNIQLKVGQVTQVVEVNSGPPIMQTQTCEQIGRAHV